MSSAKNGVVAMQAVYADAHAYGARLAQMLSVSSFAPSVQDAWATLVPSMTLSELQRLEVLLRADLDKQITHAFEDFFIEIRAEIAKRDLALAGAQHAALRSFDDIEEELQTLERAGGKKD